MRLAVGGQSSLQSANLTCKFIKTCAKLVIASILVTGLVGCASTSMRQSGNLPSVYVEAVGYGSNPDSALKDAFRDAIQRTYGVLISSKLSLVNGKLVTDNIDEYSGAFISKYEVQKTVRSDKSIKVEIGALVSSTKLLNRITELSSSSSVKNENRQIYASLVTILKSRAEGDKFLNNAAEAYPNSALVVNVKPLRTNIDENRNVYLMVPYDIAWSDGYLESLKETADYVSRGECFVSPSSKYPCDYNLRISGGFFNLGGFAGYKFADNRQARLLAEKFTSDIKLNFEFYSSGGDLVWKGCQDINVSNSESIFGYTSTARLSYPEPFLVVYAERVEIFRNKLNGIFPLAVNRIDVVKQIDRVEVRPGLLCT